MLPLAIKIGMTPNQFWDEEPDLFFAYWDAYELSQKEKANEQNIFAFNQGQYFLLALAHCLQFTKSPKKIYPKEPLKLKSDKKVKLTEEQYNEMRKAQMQRLNKIYNNKA